MATLKVIMNGVEIFQIQLDSSLEYLAGRDDACSIKLKDEAISRRHFRLYFDGSVWIVERLSKFGKLFKGDQTISNLALAANDFFTAPPYTFAISEESLQKSISPDSIYSHPELHSIKTPALFQAEPPPEGGEQFPIENVSESTDIVDGLVPIDSVVVNGDNEYSHIVPYVKLSTPDGSQLTLRLEGETWLAGRDRTGTCQIMIEDRKCSRRHFEIKRDGSGFIVTDLGSTQGTFLNGERVNPEAPQPLFSGDIIQAGDSQIIFEVRNTNFEKQLEQLPEEFKKPLENPPVPQGPVFLDPATGTPLPYFEGQMQLPPPLIGKNKLKRPNNKMIMRGAILVIALIGIWLAISDEKKSSNELSTGSSQQASTVTDPFQRLTKEQQQLVVSSYKLGDTLYKRGNYEAALREFEKIHELIPQYEDSKKYESYARTAIQQLKTKKEIEDNLARQRQIQAKIVAILNDCEAKSKSVKELAVIQACLAPAVELDPNNQRAANLITQLQIEKDQREKEKEQAQNYQERVRRGEDLFKKAQTTQKTGYMFRTIAAYEEHLKASYPDPKNLKETSKKEIARIRQEIKNRVNSLLATAREDYTGTKYRDAVTKLDKALDLEPENVQAQELRRTITNDLGKKMKTLYSESVLEESFGRVEEAKEKWRQILNTDIPSGEYYGKAKLRLSKYGDK